MRCEYGSEVIVKTLQALGIRYAAMNPGASWRGLHSSLAEATSPELIMTLQENVAVAIAHGYAKATTEPMAAVLHNVVGLQTGSMGIFNAWINQAPIMVLGGSGPADHMHRRPWIDWIHSARPQSLVAREVVKWDDEPVSAEGIPSSLLRAHRIATAAPQGPTYVNFDSLLQEEWVGDRDIAIPDGPLPQSDLTAPQADLERMAEILVNAERPVIVADYVGRSREGFDALRALAERLWAPVVDCGSRHNFPTRHPLDQALRRAEVLQDADVVLALDCRDLQWALSKISQQEHGYHMSIAPEATVVGMSLTDLMHRGFLNREAVYPADLMLTADTRVALPVLAELVEQRSRDRSNERWVAEHTRAHEASARHLQKAGGSGGPISVPQLTRSTWEAVREGPWQLAFAGTAPGQSYYSLRSCWELEQWNCNLGPSGGAGLGYGLGASIGAALAHRDDDTLVVNLQADGDALYTPQALWTAAHHAIPLLTVVLNNRTYGQDRMHQTVVTRQRGSDMSRVPLGIDIDGPPVSFADMARSQGVEAFGAIEDPAQLSPTLSKAVRIVREERRPVLVDVVLKRPEF
ncbi:MAG: thiamine pyrophosphate-binding protein [Nitriliruptorales bacterium]|nr:thiamine pyrophosphate-binding protein [Nitriliruptorales bacterium]